MSNGIMLKKRNMLNVLAIIKKYGPVTKPEVAARAGMTAVSVHNFMNELLEKHILVECGNASSNGGRKPVLYRLNPSYGFMIGQYLGLSGIQTALFDFGMEKLVTLEAAHAELSVDETIDLMAEQINKLIADYRLTHNACLGIGITVPGQIDPDSGKIKKLTNMPMWNGVPLRSRIEQATGLPVYLENDNKAIALAIKWLDEVNENASIVYVAIGTGVGAGILYHGELFNGQHHNAGEIGHITIQSDGLLCNCGNRGCLELMLSDKAITGRVIQEWKKTSADGKLLDESNWGIGKMIRLGLAGEPVVQRTLKDVCRYVTICIDNIVKIYDPEEIIIGCSWLSAFPEMFESLVEEYFKKSQWVEKEQVNIRMNATDDIFVVGAATLVLEELYKFSMNHVLLGK